MICPRCDAQMVHTVMRDEISCLRVVWLCECNLKAIKEGKPPGDYVEEAQAIDNTEKALNEAEQEVLSLKKELQDTKEKLKKKAGELSVAKQLLEETIPFLKHLHLKTLLETVRKLKDRITNFLTGSSLVGKAHP